MKKIFLICALALLSSCGERYGETEIWDFATYDIKINVHDAEGDNLLDPAFEGNILGNNITATLRGNTYKLNGEMGNDPLRTRAYPAFWGGFRTSHENEILIGKIGQEYNADHEQVVINWGDGSSTTLWFTCYLTWDKNHQDPTMHRGLWLKTNGHPDGEWVGDDYAVSIVK